MGVVSGKVRVASWHRWLGLGLTIPLAGWVISAAIMMVVTVNAPNGLAGVYTLNPYNSVDARLDQAVVTPTALLETLASTHGIKRLYWVRLQSRGPHLWYVVKPTPFALAMVFDARTGARLDPLPDSLLAVVANEALVGGSVGTLESATEYNRYYEVDRVPVVRAHLVGTQPATLILSRDEGRTLRRLNSDSERFNWWYRAFHVNQFSDHQLFWTSLLFACAVGVIALAVLGYLMFWWRRRPDRTSQAPTTGGFLPHRRIRNWHRKLGALAGGVLAVELLVGVYLWTSLGPLEDPFRGKASFSTNWQAGFTTADTLADAGTVMALVAAGLPAGDRPVQAIEWRRLGEQDAWAVTTRMDEAPQVFSATTGEPISAISPSAAGEIARHEVLGNPSFIYGGTAPQLWMDLNRPLPTYKFRFADAWNSDVYVAQSTGQIIQRRPLFWRVFGPFLSVHTFAFTGNKPVDVTLLVLFQLSILAMVATGWRLQFPGPRPSNSRAASDSTDAIGDGA